MAVGDSQIMNIFSESLYNPEGLKVKIQSLELWKSYKNPPGLLSWLLVIPKS